MKLTDNMSDAEISVISRPAYVFMFQPMKVIVVDLMLGRWSPKENFHREMES